MWRQGIALCTYWSLPLTVQESQRSAVGILSDNDVLCKTIFSLASSFSTSIKYSDPKPDLS